ncbi:MAG TPA: sulfur carrier protein ThiS [Bryobacteraceae bacterium]|nr:sulfur carrier protein ThiS [Bryobacteraceae bacterium]
MVQNVTPIVIVVNGETREVHPGDTIADLVRALDLDPEHLAIEVDRHIVKRATWADTVLTDGAKLEIVRFVGGG